MLRIVCVLLVGVAAACGPQGEDIGEAPTDDGRAHAVCASTSIGDAKVTASEGGSGGWQFTLDDGSTVNVTGDGKPFVNGDQVGVSFTGKPCPSG